MKLLITGAGGQLGRDLVAHLSDKHQVQPLTRAQCDVADLAAVRRAIASAQPAVVLHAAAMTAVDDCESQVELAYLVNALGARNVAIACRGAGAWLVAFSTDYVFSGQTDRPYHEFDRPDPQNVYGASKLAGEDFIRQQCPNHLIVRTAWLYGPGGANFVATIMDLAGRPADADRPIRAVTDQRGSPTSTAALCRQVNHLLDDLRPGTVHAACHGTASRFELAQQVLSTAKLSRQLHPCSSAEFPRPAGRPSNSALDNLVLQLEARDIMPHWTEALRDFLERPK